MADAPSSARSNAKHLVILMHGINTRALWTYQVKPALEEAGFTVAATSYGRYSVVRFLLPFGLYRRAAKRRVLDLVRTAIAANDPEKVSVISHSFGTYLMARILAEDPDITWNRIIFCGSVVRETFPLEHYRGRFEKPILNEVGTRDFWPAVAESAGWGYGSIGSHGLNHPLADTRWHEGFTHSDFLTKDFATKFWAPFLENGKIVPASPASALPRWIRLITWLPLRYGPVLIIAGLGALFFAPDHVRRTEPGIRYSDIQMAVAEPLERLWNLACSVSSAYCSVRSEDDPLDRRVIAAVEFIDGNRNAIARTSGLLLTGNGYLITIFPSDLEPGSVTEYSVYLGGLGSPKYVATMVESQKGIALLKLAIGSGPVPKQIVTLRSDYPLGTPVSAKGFVVGQAVPQLVQGNIIGELNDRFLIPTDLPTSPGMLGAPVFDDDKRLVGLVCNSPDASTNVMFICPALLFRSLLAFADIISTDQ